MAEPSSRAERARARRKRLALGAATAAMSSVLVACGSDSDKPVLQWYTNPDVGGQDAVAKECSTDEYSIETQVLPTDATQQRIQLARRLAANDSSIDIMSIDPPYTAEFANAGYLEPMPQDFASQLEEQSFRAAIEAATWEGELVAAPFWSNTQVLWYRKSFVEKTDLDMSEPVTWDQIIDAAAENDGTVAVQANKYEAYPIWINALVAGAGGSLVENAEAGADAEVALDTPEGQEAARIVQKLADSKAAPADLSVSTEGTGGTTFGGDKGAFMVNWTYIFHNYDETDPDVAKDIGYARYPRTVEDQESKPPYGGIGLGVSKFSENIDLAIDAIKCLTSPESQGINAEITGNMPASAAGYEYPALQKAYPADLLELFQESVDTAEPRSVTPYWSDISSGIQSTWHPPSSVDDQTPGRSVSFIEDVLQGEKLL
jgi:multiple sugar transport system substrate-binding protein